MVALCLFALLVAPALASAAIDCSQGCSGEPMDCDPSTSCKTLFRFDEHGHLDLYLRNFTEPMGYAAFPVKRHVNGTLYEYFICIPHRGQRLRAFAKLGDQVLVTEQELTGVETLGLHNFRCQFNKLPKKFQQSHEFSVSTGIFTEPLVITNRIQLYSVNSLPPATHYISGSLDSDLESIFTPEDGDALTGAIREMQSLSETEEEDLEMESLAKKVETRQSSKARRQEESKATKEESKSRARSEEDLDEDEYTPRRREDSRRRSSKASRDTEEDEDSEDEYTPRRREDSRRRSSKASRNTDEDEDSEDEYTPRRREDSRRRSSKGSRNTKSLEEDEDSEDEYTPRRRDNKRGRRYEEDEDEEYSPKRKSKTPRRKYDDDEEDDELPRRRSTGKKGKSEDDDDEYENDDEDEEEDEDNSCSANVAYIVIISMIFRFF